jgi:hypothetical protein
MAGFNSLANVADESEIGGADVASDSPSCGSFRVCCSLPRNDMISSVANDDFFLPSACLVVCRARGAAVGIPTLEDEVVVVLLLLLVISNDQVWYRFWWSE